MVYDAGYRLLNFPSSTCSSASPVRERTVFIFLEGRTEADGCHASSYGGGGREHVIFGIKTGLELDQTCHL